jgi:hypothetical protein
MVSAAGKKEGTRQVKSQMAKGVTKIVGGVSVSRLFARPAIYCGGRSH